MEETLQHKFTQSRAQPVEVDGQTVYLAFPIAISGPCRIEAGVLVCRSPFPSGVVVSASPGKIDWNGVKRPSVICWYDKEPWRLVVTAEPGRAGGTVRIWNAWRGTSGQTLELMGNAGMIVERPDPDRQRYIAHCSVGGGKIDFEQFVFWIELFSHV